MNEKNNLENDLDPEVIKVRDKIITKIGDNPLEEVNSIIKKLLNEQMDEVTRIGALAARLKIIRSKIDLLYERKVKINKEPVSKPTPEKKEDKVTVEEQWVRVKMVETGDVNGKQIDKGVVLDVKEDDAQKLIDAKKAILDVEKPKKEEPVESKTEETVESKTVETVESKTEEKPESKAEQQSQLKTEETVEKKNDQEVAQENKATEKKEDSMEKNSTDEKKEDQVGKKDLLELHKEKEDQKDSDEVDKNNTEQTSESTSQANTSDQKSEQSSETDNELSSNEKKEDSQAENTASEKEDRDADEKK